MFRKKSRDSAHKLSKKLSAVGIVEELFEEGSAMLAERLVDFLQEEYSQLSFQLQKQVFSTVIILSRKFYLLLGFSEK